MKKLAKAQAGKIVKSAVKAVEKTTPKKFVTSPGLNVTTRTATRVPATRGRVTGYSKEFKNKYNNAVNAAFLGAMGAGAAASGVFSGGDKKPIKKTVSDTTSIKKKMGGSIKSKKK